MNELLIEIMLTERHVAYFSDHFIRGCD